MSDIDEALEALQRIDDAQDFPQGVEVGEVFVEEFRTIRRALERQRVPSFEDALTTALKESTYLLSELRNPRRADALWAMHDRRIRDNRTLLFYKRQRKTEATLAAAPEPDDEPRPVRPHRSGGGRVVPPLTGSEDDDEN